MSGAGRGAGGAGLRITGRLGRTDVGVERGTALGVGVLRGGAGAAVRDGVVLGVGVLGVVGVTGGGRVGEPAGGVGAELITTGVVSPIRGGPGRRANAMFASPSNSTGTIRNAPIMTSRSVSGVMRRSRSERRTFMVAPV